MIEVGDDVLRRSEFDGEARAFAEAADNNYSSACDKIHLFTCILPAGYQPLEEKRVYSH
jgi:hypothetical protein